MTAVPPDCGSVDVVATMSATQMLWCKSHSGTGVRRCANACVFASVRAVQTIADNICT